MQNKNNLKINQGNIYTYKINQVKGVKEIRRNGKQIRKSGDEMISKK